MPGDVKDNEGAAKVTENAQLESISAPRLQPPSMSDSNIESYFLSLEFWFAASGINNAHDARKFNIVMAQVPPNKLTSLRAIIDGVPTQDKYTYIKTKLIEHFADSQQKRLQKVLSDMPLGDMKPSQLFNEMKRVAGSSLSDVVLLDLWAARLPPHAQAAVIASRGDAIDKVTIADAIVETMGLRNINSVDLHVSQPSHTHSEKPAPPTIESLQREIAQLSSKFEKAFSARDGFRGRSRSRSRSKPVFTRREKTPADENCWYHRTYGNDAQRCRKPCSFSKASASGAANKQ